MKVLVIAALLATSSFAMADQATDSVIDGAITCTGHGFTITITKNRKTLTIRKDGEKAEVYHDLEQMAGDTETNYTPKGMGAPTLSFNDQGDFLQFNSKQDGVSISCPQGDSN